MRLVDIDRIQEIDNHIYYIKVFKGSLVLMDKYGKIVRRDIKFNIEYKPLGDSIINYQILDDGDKLENLSEAIKKKIKMLDEKGILAQAEKITK